MNRKPNFLAFTVAHSATANQLHTDAEISIPYNYQDPSVPEPPSEKVIALWDTGASGSVITKTLAQKMNLQPSGKTRVNHAAGTSDHNTYLIHIYLPNRVAFPAVRVSEADIAHGFDLIIGMDIITKGDFALTNVGGQTIFSFRVPSVQTVDFVKDFNKSVFSGVGANQLCPCNSGLKYKKCHKGQS